MPYAKAKTFPLRVFYPFSKNCFRKLEGYYGRTKIKLMPFKAALYPDLRDAFTIIKPPTVYNDYVSELMGLASRKEAAKTTTAWQPRVSRKAANTSQDFNVMDWEPSVNTAAMQQEDKALKGKRAKWVSQKEIQRRKDEKRCLCCSRKGCNTRKCPLLPPIRPANATTSANAVASVNTAVVEELN